MAQCLDMSSCSAGVAQVVLGLFAQRPSSDSTPAVSSRQPTAPTPSGFEQVLTVLDEVQALGFCLPSEMVKVRATATAFGGRDGLVRTETLDRLVSHFLEKRPSQFGRIGMPTLHDAAELGDFEAAWAHLYKGASPNAYDRHGCVPLHYAAELNNVGVYRLLANAGADLHAVHKAQDFRAGWTPLHFAAYAGAPQVLLMLLLRGVEVNCQDEFRRTAASFAKSRGRDTCFRLLQKFGGEHDTHKMEKAVLDKALHHVPGATQEGRADLSDCVWDSSTDAADMFVEGRVTSSPTNLGDF